MAPKRADQINKGRRLSQATVVIVSEPGQWTTSSRLFTRPFRLEIQQCVGKFAADFEFCCHEPSLSYPVTIPVLIRGHSQAVAPPGTHSGTSVAPSVITGISEEHIPSNVKRASRGRLSFGGQSFVINGITAIENDNRSINTTGNSSRERGHVSQACAFQCTNHREHPYRSRTKAFICSVIVSSSVRNY